MAKEKSPLADLFVNEDELTDELVRELLAPYVGLSKTEDRIVPKPEFGHLPQASRILLYLLARRAMVKLSVPGASVEAETGKIAQHTVMPTKSCGEILSRLKSKALVDKNTEGYFIPGHALLRVSSELGKGNS